MNLVFGGSSLFEGQQGVWLMLGVALTRLAGCIKGYLLLLGISAALVPSLGLSRGCGPGEKQTEMRVWS